MIGEKNRKILIEKLFNKFLGKSTSEFVNQFYLNIHDLKYLKRLGMFFGSHGNTHRWLDTLDYYEQKNEIEQSFNSLKKLGLISKDESKAICFPFGAYNQNTLKILKNLKIDIGFSTKVGSAKFKKQKEFILKLPRWDTNEFWNNKLRKPCFPK